MSTSRAIKPKRDDAHLSNWESTPERAPSLERVEKPVVARILAMAGLFLFVLGGLAMLAPAIWSTRSAAITPGWGFFFGSIGIVLLIYHCFVERDQQFRRIYALAGVILVVVAGLGLRLLAFKAGVVWKFTTGVEPAIRTIEFTGPELFFYIGVPSLFIGLILVLAVIRNETDAFFRSILLNLLGGMGALMIASCLVVSVFGKDLPVGNFLGGEGPVLFLFGLLYAGAYIGQQEATSERWFQAGAALGGAGLLSILAGLVRSLLPESNFLVPGGLVLIGMGLVYVACALSVCVDWPIVVLTRRELAAYFYSPIAYLVLVGIVVTGLFMFHSFVGQILEYGQQGAMFEPIIERYIFHITPVIVQMFIVPALTMRLLSEEKRTATLEVLLTAPVNEISVVLGKFFACWIFYMLTWLPWWFYLVSLRFLGGEEFDYRPVLSFSIALGSISAGLLAMGLFFSCLTSNQIIAAVLTFVGMIAHLAFYIIKFERGIREGSAIHETLTHINFFDLWQNSLGGIIAPRHLIFHVSVAVFFLFATIKVLESRKWK